MKELPIACELAPPELDVRRKELLSGLLALAQERISITNELRWRFAPTAEFLTAAAKTIDAERQCCQFLKFLLTVEPDAGDMLLEITGPEGTAEFLNSLFPD